MKNNKGMIILLVALALLTLVVVIGLFFFYPKDVKTAASPATPATPATTVTPLPDQFDPVEWTRNPQPSGLQAPASPGITGAQTTGDQSFTVTLPPAQNQNAAPAPVAFPGDTAPAAPKAAPKPATPATPKVAVKPVKKVKVTEYWIQVGSFKDRYQAENTAKTLETQGLKGTLTTATVAGQSVVRVRVGPYTNEAEAGKFLAWLKPIKEFESSYVTKAVALRAE
jgi:cell division protein FtsN